MLLRARFLAWINTSQQDRKAQKRISRAKMYEGFLELPPSEVSHLIENTNEIGMCSFENGSASPIEWREIESWVKLSGRRVSTWECRMIRKISEEYARGLSEFDGVLCNAPQ